MEPVEGQAAESIFDPAVFLAANPHPSKGDFQLQEDELKLWAV
jgi:hypothetical protein